MLFAFPFRTLAYDFHSQWVYGQPESPDDEVDVLLHYICFDVGKQT